MLTFLSFSNPLTPVIYTLSLHDALPIYVGFDALPDEKIVVCGVGQAIEQLESVRTRHGMYRPAHIHVVALDRREWWMFGIGDPAGVFGMGVLRADTQRGKFRLCVELDCDLLTLGRRQLVRAKRCEGLLCVHIEACDVAAIRQGRKSLHGCLSECFRCRRWLAGGTGRPGDAGRSGASRRSPRVGRARAASGGSCACRAALRGWLRGRPAPRRA